MASNLTQITNSQTLKERAIRAGAWSFLGYGLLQTIRLGSSLIMTRLLVPEMFGVMALATMITVILSVLSDIGVDQKIIQSNRGDDPLFLDTAWIIQIVRGFLIWLMALLVSFVLYLAITHSIAPPESVYASRILPLVLAVNSISAVILGFRASSMISAHRSFDQKRFVHIEVVSQVAALLVMIVIGAITRSIWALVMGGLVAALTMTVLSHTWMKGHRNRFRWDASAGTELFGFGKWILFSSALGVLAANGDRILLGGLVNAELLGLYAIAMLIIGAIQGGIGRVLTAVSLPALSEIARTTPSRLREIYYRLRLPGDVVLLFLAGFLFAAGQLVIDVLYDPRYTGAGKMLQLLAMWLFAVRYEAAHHIYLALGLPHYLASINAVRALSLYCAVPLLYYLKGVEGAILAVALHALPAVALMHVFNGRLQLNNFRWEAAVLLLLPLGYACGQLLTP